MKYWDEDEYPWPGEHGDVTRVGNCSWCGRKIPNSNFAGYCSFICRSVGGYTSTRIGICLTSIALAISIIAFSYLPVESTMEWFAVFYFLIAFGGMISFGVFSAIIGKRVKTLREV